MAQHRKLLETESGKRQLAGNVAHFFVERSRFVAAALVQTVDDLSMSAPTTEIGRAPGKYIRVALKSNNNAFGSPDPAAAHVNSAVCQTSAAELWAGRMGLS